MPILQWSGDTSKIELKYLKWKRMRVDHCSMSSQRVALNRFKRLHNLE